MSFVPSIPFPPYSASFLSKALFTIKHSFTWVVSLPVLECKLKEVKDICLVHCLNPNT